MKEKLAYCFQTEPKSEGEEEEQQMSIIELTELEIESVVEELSSEHADTEKYTTQVENLKKLTEAFEKMAKAEAELDKAELETIQTVAKRKIDWSVVGPKVAGVVVYGLVTVGFIAIEREHPPAMRIVQAANNLLRPQI